ncbi:MAG: TIGR03936 family radical SAM-associated protein [Anaerovibrio sp.]|nr:TIGR03936 family radical SAM-associated protein [Anaerovibrio sp.]
MYKYRAEITKGEEIRYISHLDYAGVMERAIRRAKLPAAYSEGFNPHIKIAFASALSLGVVSEAEYMDFELTKPLCQPEVFEKLSRALPPGVKLLRLKQVWEPQPCRGKKHKALMAEVEEAEYELYLPFLGDWEEAAEAVEAYNKAAEATVHRVTPKTDRLIETKQYLLQPVRLSMAGGQLRLYMDIAITPSGSVKPGEILGLLKEQYHLPVDIGRALIKRIAMKGRGKALIDLV